VTCSKSAAGVLMLGVGGPLGRCCDILTFWVLSDNSSLKTAPLRSEKLIGRLL
jgi:hypothetical protein